MSKYLLKISGSNEIESIFEWDGSGSLTPPPEYEIELLTNSELEYISYIDITQQTFSIDESQNLSVGSHYGMFSGNIISSTINGLSLGYHINATEYGQLSEVHKDSLTENSYISQSWFSVIDDNTIMLSDTNGSYRYENILSEIIKNNEKNYVLSLIRDTIGSETAEFIVKNTEKIENGIYSMYQLTVDNINYISSSLFNAAFIQNEKIPWNIDFKFNTSNDISSEYTGSFTGSFDGDFFVDGENFDETFKIAPKPCTILKYEEDVINQLPTDGGLNPQGGYFIFDKDTSINGDQYGENSWRFEKPTRIRLNLHTLGDTAQQNEYEEKLFKIIRERLGESEITLEQILPNSLTAAYKKFQIIRGIYRERSRRKDVNQSYPVKYHYLDWGSQTFEETDRYFGQEDIDYFYGDGEFGLDFNSIGTDSARDGFFEFEVKQIEPLNVDPDVKPEQDAEFRVCVTERYKRREVTVFTESGEYTVPDWSDTITMYAIGAGGGGGGGSWGYAYNINPFDASNFEKFDASGFELATGGGGGAGGCVAKSVYKWYEFQTSEKKLNVLVGSPGKGGIGLNYDLPFPTTEELTVSPPFKNTLYFEYGYTFTPNQRHISKTRGKKNNLLKIIDFNATPKYEIYEDKFFGKKGGDSAVYSNNGKIYVKANGGYGGNPGVSLAGNWPIGIDMMPIDSYFGYDIFDPDLRRNGVSSALTLGGGSHTKGSVGNVYVTPGGPGGYGSHTVPFTSMLNYLYEIDVVQYLEKFGVDAHIAPNIPSLKKYNTHILNYDDSKPMGVLYENLNGINKRDALMGKYLSTERPISLAPPGGGGGFGVRMTELADQVPFSTRSSIVNFLYDPTDTLPDPYFSPFGNIGKYDEVFVFEGKITYSLLDEHTNLYPMYYTVKVTSPAISEADRIKNQSFKLKSDGFIYVRNCTSIDDREMELVITEIHDDTFYENSRIGQSPKTIILTDTLETSKNYYKTIVYGVTGNVYTELDVVEVDGVVQEQPRIVIPVKELAGYSNALVYPNGIIDKYKGFSEYHTFQLFSEYSDSDLKQVKILASDTEWLESDITYQSSKSSKFLNILPFDGIQRFETANRYAKLGTGGKVIGNNVLIYEIGNDVNGNPINLTIGNGGNGGFGRYFSVGRGKELRPELSNTPPEDVSDRYGVGGGGGAAIYLRNSDSWYGSTPMKGQDGADGGPGIVVIIAEILQ